MKALKDQIRHDLIVTQPILYYRLIFGIKPHAILECWVKEKAMLSYKAALIGKTQ